MQLAANVEPNHRILIVDDNPAIHADLRKILAGVSERRASLKDYEDLLFGTTEAPMEHFEIDSAYQGEEGLQKVKSALAEGRPYALAFVDVRMPPGWDGVEAIAHFLAADPDLQTVICTAYSDYSWSDIRQRIGRSDSLLILKKPFDNIEVIQLAYTMTEKWLLNRQAKVKLSDLDRMVASRTAELETARLAAESASKAKSQFLANISHEIRTPINGILGFTQLTLNSELTPEQKANLTTVESCTISLMKTVNEILDFSKFEAGRVQLEQESFSLRTSVEDAARTLLGTAQQKGLEMTCQVDTGGADAVVGDAYRLRQVILNLTGNAIKFTQKGSVRVNVQATPGPGQTCSVHCSVQDTGIGIPSDKQLYIFEAFRQADGSTSRRYGGTGLGLAICRQIIGMMGGRLWVESEEGHGSTFQFTVTLHRAESVPSIDSPRTVRELEVPPLSVLIAEDNKVSQRLMATLLKRRGHRVTIVENGLEVLAALERQSFDLLLLDIQMPEMDGMEAAGRIRQRETQTGDRIPIVALTAHASQEDREEILQAGIDGYVTKPVVVNELFTAILGRPDSAGHHKLRRINMTTYATLLHTRRQSPLSTQPHPPTVVPRVSPSRLTHARSPFSEPFRRRVMNSNGRVAPVTLVSIGLTSRRGTDSQLAITRVNGYRNYQHMGRYDIFRQTALGYCFYGESGLAFVHGCTTHERQRITDSEPHSFDRWGTTHTRTNLQNRG